MRKSVGTLFITRQNGVWLDTPKEVPVMLPPKPRQYRQYGLFERQAGKWVRLSPHLAFDKAKAIVIFQNALLQAALTPGHNTRSLRPVRPLPPLRSLKEV